jgi:hypothetical protein
MPKQSIPAYFSIQFILSIVFLQPDFTLIWVTKTNWTESKHFSSVYRKLKTFPTNYNSTCGPLTTTAVFLFHRTEHCAHGKLFVQWSRTGRERLTTVKIRKQHYRSGKQRRLLCTLFQLESLPNEYLYANEKRLVWKIMVRRMAQRSPDTPCLKPDRSYTQCASTSIDDNTQFCQTRHASVPERLRRCVSVQRSHFEHLKYSRNISSVSKVQIADPSSRAV